MEHLIKLIKSLIGISFLIFLFVFPPLLVLSLFIVPATILYSKLNGQSYNFTMDQSETIYRLNKFGQMAWLFGGGVLLLIILLSIL